MQGRRPMTVELLRLLSAGGGRRGVRRHGGLRAQPGPFGPVPDPRLLQLGRPVRPDRRRVPGDDPGRRLCRRGGRAVHVRGHDARHQLRSACARASCSSCRSGSRRHHPAGRAGPGRRHLGRWRAWAAPAAARRRRPVSNIEAIGNLLYTDYFYLFQAAGLILLVAIIGAITLTLRHRPRAPPGHRAAGRPAARRDGRAAQGAHRERRVMADPGLALPDAGRDPVHDRRVRHLPQPQERDHHPDVDRADPARGQHQLRRVLGLPGRPRRPDLRHVRPDRRGRRGGDRARDRRGLFPQPRQHRGRRHQPDEGLRRGHAADHPGLLARAGRPDRRPVRPHDRRPRRADT